MHRESSDYIITDSVRRHMQNLARVVQVGKFPILLQGPTSSGKTSMVLHMARSTGRRCIRINNHEHTEIGEYLGSYVTGEDGGLVFQYGALVEAVRRG